jgi:hypothetical protein
MKMTDLSILLKMDPGKKIQTHNSTFAISGVSCSADSFVVAESAVLRMNICAEKAAHRKSAKRYVPFKKQHTNLKQQ